MDDRRAIGMPKWKWKKDSEKSIDYSVSKGK
jgi:hypothetical protein